MNTETALVVTNDFDFNSQAYRQLLESASVTAFQRAEWLSAYFRHLCDAPGLQPAIVLGFAAQTRELQLVLPLVRSRSHDQSIVEYACGDVTDYVCPVVHKDLFSDRKRLADIRSRLTGLLRTPDGIRIGPVRKADCAIWEELLGMRPQKLDFGRHEVAPVPPLQDWRRMSYGPKRAAQLARKLRRLGDCGELCLETVPSDEATEAVDWCQHMRKGRFRDDPIQRPATLSFYREISSGGTGGTLTRTYRLRCDSQTVAVCFGLVDGLRFSFLVLACDYAKYGAFSPGIVMLNLAMEDWVSTGGRVFDFTIGDEPYKRDFRCRRYPMYEFVSDSPPWS